MTAIPPRPEVPGLLGCGSVKMAGAVVGVEIQITGMEGKQKLSQNRPEESIRGAIEGLRKSGDSQAIEVARLMEHNLE